MSIVQVANVHFNSGGTSRIDSPTGNAVGITINSANTLYIAQDQVTVKTSANITGDLAVTGNIYFGGALSGNANVNIFTANGTWTKPNGLKRIKVTVVGGGAAAADSSGLSGKGGGGAAIKWMPAPSISGPVAVTVGFAGPISQPGDGGTSSFGPTVSATGGSSGGPGGTGSGGDINITGGSGGGGFDTGPGGTGGLVITVTGKGGDSILGFGGTGAMTVATWPSIQSIASNSGVGYGAGASGRAAGPSTLNRAAGTQGIVIIEEFY